MYLCLRDIDVASFYDFDIVFGISDSVAFIVFGISDSVAFIVSGISDSVAFSVFGISDSVAVSVFHFITTIFPKQNR
jgi:uncharacterized Tic20 family protein